MWVNRRHRREPIELQLTSMIDVFAIIVIFLILSSVFGSSETLVPPGMALPKSTSKEWNEASTTLIIGKNEVKISTLAGTYNLALFESGGRNSEQLNQLRGQIQAYIKNLPSDRRTAGRLLSVLADHETPYKTIFDVVKFFRENGFESLMFLATSEGEAG